VSVAVTIIARDEGHRIAQCLESVRWADEIVVVVDERTTDDTEAVARRFTDRVFRRAFDTFPAQRQFADDQARADWILSVDCDEVVTPELAAEVAATLRAPAATVYRVPHRDWMFGRWMRHAGTFPQYHFRLYRRGAARWGSAVHERVAFEGALGTLRQPLLHYSHLTVADWIAKMSAYTTTEAQMMFEHGERAGAWRILSEPPLYFGYKYVVQQGWRDGMHGLVISLLLGAYRLVRNLKLWDLQQRAANPRDPRDSPPPQDLR
jgi:glycosyltransferase involved in cell wall biosynthesis